MVKFNLRFFKSCQTNTPPEPSSPPSQRRKVITGDSPCTTSKQTPHRSSFKSRLSSAFRCGSKSGNQTHVVTKLHDVVSDEERLENPNYPSRSFSDVGVRSRHNHGGGGQESPEWGSPARLSVFKKLMPCKVEGKCFLSLNSWYHHGVIMEAFSEIWNNIFLDQ
ncbi:hypothetical protein L1987_74780 [Smallanthus sonchifolius]|uniref:Uncharacterized protein n=1 Tax=Smallanthus sonchifolius TaxID=185202 RepID=A0ACB9A3I4_9ASTR|nr:hypothetical protein L1987_89950 [Smallanthus sonchifolius]KAI3704556.1 hypothetical protein L1987_74780 [Smallanthus sonchifolius]